MSKTKSADYRPTRRASFKTHASKVLQESSVGMVSSLAQTSSIRRKIFKFLALALCLFGFLYQSGVFLEHVFQYPTTVDVEVVRPNMFNVPGYTICDNNEINRRIFCEKYPKKCEEPSEDFCKKYEYYCGKNKTLAPKKEYYSFSHNKSLEELIEFNMDLGDFIHVESGDEVEVVETMTGPYLRKLSYKGPSYLCYSLNDRVNSSLTPIQTEKSTLFRYPVNRFELNIQTEEMFLPGSRAGVLFAIHSPFEAVNPFEKGIFMKPGRTYIVYVSMEEEMLLQKPYETDCVNYTERWENNGRSGPRTQNMCLQDCIAKISLKCFNCVVPVLLYPTKEKICSPDVVDINKCPSDIYDHIFKCEASCRDDCRQTKYRYTVQERFTTYFDENGTTRENLDKTIIIEVHLEGDEIIILKHLPKYMIVEVFSTIGGFIGCWLGISLLDITDIFEGFFRIFRHSFKKR